jgi:RND family efflux transporter MFP subunit
MKLIIKILLPLLVIAAGVGIAYLLEKSKPEPEKKQDVSQVPSIFVAPVEQRDAQLTVSTQGDVRAVTEVDLVSQLSGRIKAVSPEFIEGGHFRAGDPLLWIENEDYRLAVKRAQALLAEANVRVKQTRADAEVARVQLVNTRNPSALALKKPQLAEAKANLQAAQADVELARLNLKRTQISLPFAGRIKSINANIGQYVTVGSRLGRAFATGRVKLRLPLTDHQLAHLGLSPGFIATKSNAPVVDISAEVAGKLLHWQGKLTRIDAFYDQQSRLLYALAEVEKPYDQDLYPIPLVVGLFVNVDIDGRKVKNALIIPRAALRAGNLVYRVNDKNRLDIIDVEVAFKSPEMVIVKGALQKGDKVVVSAVRNPIQGMEVHTMQEQP